MTRFMRSVYVMSFTNYTWQVYFMNYTWGMFLYPVCQWMAGWCNVCDACGIAPEPTLGDTLLVEQRANDRVWRSSPGSRVYLWTRGVVWTRSELFRDFCREEKSPISMVCSSRIIWTLLQRDWIGQSWQIYTYTLKNVHVKGSSMSRKALSELAGHWSNQLQRRS